MFFALVLLFFSISPAALPEPFDRLPWPWPSMCVDVSLADQTRGMRKNDASTVPRDSAGRQQRLATWHPNLNLNLAAMLMLMLTPAP